MAKRKSTEGMGLDKKPAALLRKLTNAGKKRRQMPTRFGMALVIFFAGLTTPVVAITFRDDRKPNRLSMYW